MTDKINGNRNPFSKPYGETEPQAAGADTPESQEPPPSAPVTARPDPSALPPPPPATSGTSDTSTTNTRYWHVNAAIYHVGRAGMSVDFSEPGVVSESESGFMARLCLEGVTATTQNILGFPSARGFGICVYGGTDGRNDDRRSTFIPTHESWRLGAGLDLRLMQLPQGISVLAGVQVGYFGDFINTHRGELSAVVQGDINIGQILDISGLRFLSVRAGLILTFGLEGDTGHRPDRFPATLGIQTGISITIPSSTP